MAALGDDARAPLRDFPIPHDGYLKAFCQKMLPADFDIILLDEAQDTNGALLDWLKAQSARVALCGDPNQSIYAWRGAVDAMQAPCDETRYLTASFRFGPEIAEYGDAVLTWIDPQMPRLSGVGEPGYIGRALKGRQLAILGRTNEGLFDKAASLVLNRPNAKVGFVGGIQGYGLDTIEQLYKLWHPAQRPDDPSIDRFPSFDELRDYAENAGEQQLLTRVKLVDKYQNQIPQIIHRLRSADWAFERLISYPPPTRPRAWSSPRWSSPTTSPR